MRVIHRRAHRLAWGLLAALLPLLLGAAAWQRASAPAVERPVLLAPP